MKCNEAGLKLIKQFEGLRLTSYLCPAGVWTVGYGHTSGVREGQTITESQADLMLRDDVEEFERIVDKAVDVPLTDNQFSALVSLCFNIGPGKKGVRDGFVSLKNGNPSSLLRSINAGKPDPDLFMAWNKVAGKPLPGLTARRFAERQLFKKDS